MKRLSLIIAVLLAGCGGTDHGTPLPPVPVPEPQLDAFFAVVSGVVASSSEDADAKDLDSITPTSPDGNDPEPL